MEKWWKKIACIWVVLLCLFTISPVITSSYAAGETSTSTSTAGNGRATRAQVGQATGTGDAVGTSTSTTSTSGKTGTSTTSSTSDKGGTSSNMGDIEKDANTELLDSILDEFNKYAEEATGSNRLLKPALFLWASLGAIEIATTFSLYEGQFRLSQMIGVILKMSFYLWLITHWWEFCSYIVDFMLDMAKLANGLDDGSVKFGKASYIIDYAWKAIAGVWTTTAIKLTNPLEILVKLLAMIGLAFGFIKIAFEVFVTWAECFLFIGLSIVFLPFNACRFTEGFGKSVINGLVGYGARLMMINFLIGLIFHVIKIQDKVKTDNKQSLANTISFAVIMLTIAYLIGKAADFAQSLVQGGGPVSSGSGLTASAKGNTVGVTRGVAAKAGTIAGLTSKILNKPLPSGGGGGSAVGSTAGKLQSLGKALAAAGATVATGGAAAPVAASTAANTAASTVTSAAGSAAGSATGSATAVNTGNISRVSGQNVDGNKINPGGGVQNKLQTKDGSNGVPPLSVGDAGQIPQEKTDALLNDIKDSLPEIDGSSLNNDGEGVEGNSQSGADGGSGNGGGAPAAGVVAGAGGSGAPQAPSFQPTPQQMAAMSTLAAAMGMTLTLSSGGSESAEVQKAKNEAEQTKKDAKDQVQDAENRAQQAEQKAQQAEQRAQQAEQKPMTVRDGLNQMTGKLTGMMKSSAVSGINGALGANDSAQRKLVGGAVRAMGNGIRSVAANRTVRTGLKGFDKAVSAARNTYNNSTGLRTAIGLASAVASVGGTYALASLGGQAYHNAIRDVIDKDQSMHQVKTGEVYTRPYNPDINQGS